MSDAVAVVGTSAGSTKPALTLSFHGRVIEHLGIQMYQSPTSALAELVANAWDADATTVDVVLPTNLAQGAQITIKDNGVGMTVDDCQKRFLNVGYNRRLSDPTQKTKKGRPMMGRKGIGKFAGFGIAEELLIDTISGTTGERTVFKLELSKLIGDQYVGTEVKPIEVVAYEGPDQARKASQGTSITLSKLKDMKQTPSAAVIARGLARRFQVNQVADEFALTVNGNPIPEAIDSAQVEFTFPAAYEADNKPVRLASIDANGWGTESLPGGKSIQWKFCFTKDPIEDEELRGISVFAHHKLAQKPFIFNLQGGLHAQHGLEYLFGQVVANFVDEMPKDVIATERQRINFEDPAVAELEAWGQDRIKSILAIWSKKRANSKTKKLAEKLFNFSARLDRLQPHERKTVHAALAKLAEISSLSQERFEDISQAILTSWEQGRLHELITNLADAGQMDEAALLNVLSEAEVISALHIAETVKTKIGLVKGLRARVARRDLENAVRDYIAQNPFLIAPKWETFEREKSVQHILDKAADKNGLTQAVYNGRIDLALRSGSQLLIVEFMRPGLNLDWDHLQRLERYVFDIREALRASTALGLDPNQLTGLIVADSLDRTASFVSKLESLKAQNMLAYDWESLLVESERTWEKFLAIQIQRGGEDPRLRSLLEPIPAAASGE